jgi:hypothetical protein
MKYNFSTLVKEGNTVIKRKCTNGLYVISVFSNETKELLAFYADYQNNQCF